jgi:hypothetical protein
MAKFEPGVKCVIVISNFDENRNRVVTITELAGETDCGKVWFVHDGKPFKGFRADGSGSIVISDPNEFGIGQWKLRLLEDDEPTMLDEEGIEHAVTA